MANQKLSKIEEYYIENNMNKTDDELAKDVGKSLGLVREYIFKLKSDTRVNKLLVREKGAVVMTQGASEAADNSRKSAVSEAAIQAAIQRQDYEEAARLQAMRKTQPKVDDEVARQRIEGHIHYIHGRKDGMQGRR